MKNTLDELINKLEIEEVKIGDIVEIFSQKDNKNYIGMVVKKYPKGKRIPNEIKVKIVNKNEYFLGFVRKKIGRRFKLKGDYKRMKLGVEYLRKLNINIPLKERMLLREEIDNPDRTDTVFQVLLNDAKTRIFFPNEFDKSVPYAILFIINNEIVGIQYFDKKDNLIFQFLNNNLINFV